MSTPRMRLNSMTENSENKGGVGDNFIDKAVNLAMDRMLRRQELQHESRTDENCRRLRSEG